ncbi:Phosphatidate cytidylyltransferase-domain-containing protein [Carpediemonas membranifera]|uniref:Phosphatidate cytidylyltransferase-domain-containing protein n=1 Tax=Carpediemonas membranifera TaxID=201153 RepID=A0A8J6AWP6_9EUKA|nr:Phosphatidate cytidylyltransferase-domain-containing protein [Carpediemonas membranifera]|eukprot:KAG9394370.1 Phosphatidate cytidylyltransferase-domain-containing protein [Carpediemonas membranifera]
MTLGLPWSINFRALSDPYLYMTLLVTGVSIISYFVILRFKLLKKAVNFLRISNRQRSKIIAELKRKKFHLAGSIMPILYYFSLSLNVVPRILFNAIIGSIAAFVVSLELTRMRSPKVNVWFVRTFGRIMRPEEKDKVTGTAYYLSGCAATLILFSPPIASIGIFFLVFGDLFAALVGMSFGKHKIYKSKSLEGFMGCVVACFIIGTLCLVLFKVDPLSAAIIALLGAVVAAFTELWCNGSLFLINDNFMIPVSSAAIMGGACFVLGVNPSFGDGRVGADSI